GTASPPRSRSGGMRMIATLSRWKRSSRNSPSRTAASRSRLVAAITCTSTRRPEVAPIRRTSFSSMTFRNLDCSGAVMWPISSRKMVPPSAVSKRPARAAFASVNAPFSWPKSSASTRFSGSAVQLTSMKGPFRRPPPAGGGGGGPPGPLPRPRGGGGGGGGAPRPWGHLRDAADQRPQALGGGGLAHDAARSGPPLGVVGDLPPLAPAAQRLLDLE